MFCFECVILFIHITKQSPVKFFSAPKRRKSVVEILKLIKHPMSCFEYIISFILVTKQSSVKIFRAPERRMCENKMVIVWSKCHSMNNNVSPLFAEPNILLFSSFFPSADYNVLEKF